MTKKQKRKKSLIEKKPPKKHEVLEEKSFGDHYIELRTRVFLIAITIVIATSLSFCVADEIYEFLSQPLLDAIGGDLKSRHLIFTGLAEGLMTHLKLSVVSGIFISLPIIIWQVYAFLAPGLYKREKKTILPYMIFSPLLFIAGVAFVYTFVIPAAWSFFLSFEHSKGDLPIVLEARISEYLDLILDMIIAFGVAFQLPVVLSLLAKIGVVRSKMLAKGRRYAIVLIFIAAAILTPPDVFSQITLALPLLLLYEFSILITKVTEKKDA